jgi:3-deoxy-7-phosphoheptulonate synthase
MRRTFDLQIEAYTPLIPPKTLKKELPLSPAAHNTVITGRRAIQKILDRSDPRLLVIVGPCSIHDETVALDYAHRLQTLSKKVASSMLLAMRVYFEKPRTTVGWKGLVNDPHMNGTHDMENGLRKARELLLKITEIGLPTATEFLDPITPQYLAGLICWTAIGARTTESQTHREMASGLSMPVGFKNCTDGGLGNAINAMIAAGSSQSFLGIDQNGRTSVVKTRGNPWTHLVLRGGRRPNYDAFSIQEALEMTRKKNLPEVVMVDCSHANSRKNHQNQAVVWQDVINQRMDGNRSIIGLMLESNIEAGNQKISQDLANLKYGVSITDACISWPTTEKLLLSAHRQLMHQNGKGSEDQAMESQRYRVG